MNLIRVNVLIPEMLLNESQKLVRKGYFSNFSELVREGLRMELRRYKSGFVEITEKDRKLLAWAKEAQARGEILSERDMEKHGLKL